MIIAIDNKFMYDKLNLKSFLYNINFYKNENYELVAVDSSILYNYKHVILLEIDEDLIMKLISKSVEVGIILDINDNYIEEIEKLSYKTIKNIKFITVIGGDNHENDFIENIPFVSNLRIENNNKKKLYNGIYSTEYSHDLYQVIKKEKYKFLSVNNQFNYYLNNLEKLTDEIDFMHSSDLNIYNYLSSINILYSTSTKIDQLIVEASSNNIEVNLINFNINFPIEFISIKTFYKENFTKMITKFTNKYHKDDIINIVCFKPSYLFKDLCERFVKQGCVFSDYPLVTAKAYIWMRPQEIFQYIDIINNTENKNTPALYLKLFPSDTVSSNMLKERSVAIHHGTCFEPIYQFDYRELAFNLREVEKVIGVCELEECYGPSAPIANKNNFTFIPIGYDENLFNKNNIEKNQKSKNQKINIGFVGRAYGTDNKKNLENSKLAHPKGYRKGGDILLNTALRLKNKKINFKITILGQNWDELCNRFDAYGIEYKYYAREKNIEYTEYPKIYKEFDILFIGARCEGGPVSAIEAMSLGVPIVGTNVGILKYLSKNSNYCNTFEFDRKWNTIDYDKAVDFIERIYEKETTFNDRLNIKKDISIFTTNNWVKHIIDKAREI